MKAKYSLGIYDLEPIIKTKFIDQLVSYQDLTKTGVSYCLLKIIASVRILKYFLLQHLPLNT